MRIEINDLDFRDQSFALQKRPGELRILALGDSFTFGSGVLTEDTWPQVLEGLLEARRAGPVEVINAGFATGSHHPVGYVDWLASDGVAFAPDIVVLGFCLNDMGNVPMLAYPIMEPTPWLGGISELLYSVQQGIDQRKVMGHRLDATQIVTLQPEPWEQNKDAIRAMQQIIEEHDIRLIVAVLPMLSLLGDHYPYLGLHQLVEEFCTAEGIESVDLLGTVRGRDELELWVHPTDQHPTPLGHRLLAGGIHDYLRAHPTRLR